MKVMIPSEMIVYYGRAFLFSGKKMSGPCSPHSKSVQEMIQLRKKETS